MWFDNSNKMHNMISIVVTWQYVTQFSLVPVNVSIPGKKTSLHWFLRLFSVGIVFLWHSVFCWQLNWQYFLWFLMQLTEQYFSWLGLSENWILPERANLLIDEDDEHEWNGRQTLHFKYSDLLSDFSRYVCRLCSVRNRNLVLSTDGCRHSSCLLSPSIGAWRCITSVLRPPQSGRVRNSGWKTLTLQNLTKPYIDTVSGYLTCHC